MNIKDDLEIFGVVYNKQFEILLRKIQIQVIIFLWVHIQK